MARWSKTLALLAALALLVGACGRGGDGGTGQGGGRWQEEIVIGWTPPDITGVFKTATDFFEKAASEANAAGLQRRGRSSRSPATHTAFADQVAIIEDFISAQGRRDRDLADRHGGDQAGRQAGQRGRHPGDHRQPARADQRDIEVASYIGFDNTQAAKVTAYAVLDYFGGPGVLGTGEKVDVKPDDYLDLTLWEGLYAERRRQNAGIKAARLDHRGHRRRLLLPGPRRRLPRGRRQVPRHRDRRQPCAADWNREKGIKAPRTSCHATTRTSSTSSGPPRTRWGSAR